MNEEAKNYPTGIETEAQKQLYDEHYRDFVETIEGLLRALFNLQFRVRVNPSNRNKEKMAAIHVVFSWGDDGSDTYALTEISKKEAKHWQALLLPRFLECADRINREFFISLINHYEME
jgi:hypothetical protein